MYRNIDTFFQGFANGGMVSERGRGSIYDSYPGARREKKKKIIPSPEVNLPSFLQEDYSVPVDPFTSPDAGNIASDPMFRDYIQPEVQPSYIADQTPIVGYNQNVVEKTPQQDQEQGFDYSGDVDRYSIPIGQYIPPNLRPAANILGLNDLSNFNPITGFMRDRDAMARGDYGDAAIGTGANLLTLGLGSSLRQPIKQTIGNVFGLDMGSPSTANVPTASDTMRLYHGSEYDFLPSIEVTLPDGEVKRLDDNLFDMVSPLGMTNFREGMDVSETPFAGTFEQLGYPAGTIITRADPYGRFETDKIGTGEGGYQPGSDQALNDSGGAMVGKGIYMAQRPNIGQNYRYTNANSGLPVVPYEDSFSDGVGQKTIEEAQKALIDKYGGMDVAREAFDSGADPYIGDINSEMSFNYVPKAEIESKFNADMARFANDIAEDDNLNMLIPAFSSRSKDFYGPATNPTLDTDVTISNARYIISDQVRELQDTIDPNSLGGLDELEWLSGNQTPMLNEIAKEKISEYAAMAGISEEEVVDSLSKLKSLKKKQKEFEDYFLTIDLDRQNAIQENTDFETIMNYEPGDIPGNLYISEIESSDLGRSLETNKPIDLGTLNDMVGIFGKEAVEDMFDRAGFPLKTGNIGREGLVELSDDPRGFKYAVPSEFSSRGRKPTEEIFAPRTVDEMNQLAKGGYSNLRFLDAASRNGARNPTYNYVFFGDDVMPSILDRKNKGGLVGMGIGSL